MPRHRYIVLSNEVAKVVFRVAHLETLMMRHCPAWSFQRGSVSQKHSHFYATPPSQDSSKEEDRHQCRRDREERIQRKRESDTLSMRLTKLFRTNSLYFSSGKVFLNFCILVNLDICMYVDERMRAGPCTYL